MSSLIKCCFCIELNLGVRILTFVTSFIAVIFLSVLGTVYFGHVINQ